ncbi:hypothetical protein CK203_028582 [Vitis vinifera]|uniref:Pentatricopeptide repeat-containing protein n=1 Tax=Vitis vinifera TaxID=29760 RepID=A0A438I2E4_VITVI|nr:hypothetical protein CK203_028582 [Vitis vinifera]
MALVYFPFRSKAYGHCWRAFSSLCSPSPFVELLVMLYHVSKTLLMCAHRFKDDWKSALGLFRWRSRVWGNLVRLSTVAKAMRRLAGAGEWEDAVRVFDDLGTLNWRRTQNP